MAYCKNCGATLPENVRFCPECGTPVGDVTGEAERWTHLEEVSDRPKKAKRPRKKSIFARWWFWILVVIIATVAVNRGNLRLPAKAPKKADTPIVTAAPKAASTPEAAPVQEEPQPVSETEIRPEIKEFLDSYEAFMDEYCDFMQKYSNADAENMVAMMGDYYDILARYTEFSEKISAMDQSEMTSAELAYYIEVTSRVSQKLLTVAG